MPVAREVDQFLREQAESNRIDLNRPENAYTLWAVDPNFTQANLIAQSRDLGTITARARQQVKLKNLWILPAEVSRFALHVDDNDRVIEMEELSAFGDHL